jgi:hypothetical protein
VERRESEIVIDRTRADEQNCICNYADATQLLYLCLAASQDAGRATPPDVMGSVRSCDRSLSKL